jgi:hypothetical protein
MALEKATITNLTTGDLIPVMFNPGEYSLDLGNTFAEIGIPGLRTPPIQYVRGNSRSLKMDLFFDTSDQREDVRRRTQQITTLLEQDPTIHAPPILLFSWGGLNFRAVIESVGQRFTLFTENGTPVRATLTVAFKEYEAVEIEIRRGLFVGAPAVRNVVGGQRLDQLASQLLGDPAAWREIAQANGIDNPRKLTPGSLIVVPPRPPRPAP